MGPGVRGQNCKFSGRWSDQLGVGAQTRPHQLGPDAERHLVEHLLCVQNVRFFNCDFGFVSPPKSTWFVPVCSDSRGLQKAQGNFTKNVKENYRLVVVAIRGGC
ncbi:hypothetical protein LXL04_038311, partial [Taraxacum kok-saghyz]